MARIDTLYSVISTKSVDVKRILGSGSAQEITQTFHEEIARAAQINALLFAE